MFDIILFLLGIHLTIVLLASCYRIIDLWYCISIYSVQIVSRIALYLTIIALIYYFLESKSFLYGQLFFAIFHVSIFWIGRLLLKLLPSASKSTVHPKSS